MKLVETIYRDSRAFPSHEMFGLTSQLRRAAISVPSNMAEGAARNSAKELLHFVGISCGSAAELETQPELAVRLRYLDACSESVVLAGHVGKLVRNLRKSIKASINTEIARFAR
jgi:four helix bundle protein